VGHVARFQRLLWARGEVFCVLTIAQHTEFWFMADFGKLKCGWFQAFRFSLRPLFQAQILSLASPA